MSRVSTLANWAFLAFIVVLVSIAAFMAIAFALGWRFNPVMSSSMAPTMQEGSVVAARQVNPADIEVGDIITFRSPELNKVIAHRVVEKNEGDQLYFRTKGDASNELDTFLVPAENVLSKVNYTIPYIGYASQFIKSSSGMLLFLAPLGLFLFCKAINNIRARFQKKRRFIEEPAFLRSSTNPRQWATGLNTTDWLEGQASQ